MAVVVAVAVGAAGVLTFSRSHDRNGGRTLSVEQEESGPAGPDPGVPDADDEVFLSPEALHDGARAWRALPSAPTPPRSGHEAAWTGSCAQGSAPPACGEMLVWGGYDEAGRWGRDGAAYDPETDAWRPIPQAPLSHTAAPRARWVPTAAPDGHGALIAWPVGDDDPAAIAYVPGQGAWRPLPPAPVAPRTGHVIEWTGRELVVWGGRTSETGEPTRDGAAYDPRTESWRPLPDAPLEPRYGAAAAVIDGNVVVWGGEGAEPGTVLDDGATYHPNLDRWTPLPPLPDRVTNRTQGTPRLEAVSGRLVLNQTLWDEADGQYLAVLDPHDGTWSILPWPAGLRRAPHLAAGGGSTVLLWGGVLTEDDVPLLDGVLLDVTTGTWVASLGQGGARSEPGFTALRSPVRDDIPVWTTTEFLIWGSLKTSNFRSEVGWALDPQALTADY